MSGINRDDWLNALGEAEDTFDPTAMTREELASLLGIGPTAMKERIRRLLAEGKVTISRKRVTDSTGRRAVVPAYVLVKRKRK